jgi:hypothetical protein
MVRRAQPPEHADPAEAEPFSIERAKGHSVLASMLTRRIIFPVCLMRHEFSSAAPPAGEKV